MVSLYCNQIIVKIYQIFSASDKVFPIPYQLFPFASLIFPSLSLLYTSYRLNLIPVIKSHILYVFLSFAIGVRIIYFPRRFLVYVL
jgi:hypothetical protein